MIAKQKFYCCNCSYNSKTLKFLIKHLKSMHQAEPVPTAELNAFIKGDQISYKMRKEDCRPWNLTQSSDTLSKKSAQQSSGSSAKNEKIQEDGKEINHIAIKGESEKIENERKPMGNQFIDDYTSQMLNQPLFTLSFTKQQSNQQINQNKEEQIHKKQQESQSIAEQLDVKCQQIQQEVDFSEKSATIQDFSTIQLLQKNTELAKNMKSFLSSKAFKRDQLKEITVLLNLLLTCQQIYNRLHKIPQKLTRNRMTLHFYQLCNYFISTFIPLVVNCQSIRAQLFATGSRCWMSTKQMLTFLEELIEFLVQNDKIFNVKINWNCSEMIFDADPEEMAKSPMYENDKQS